MYCPYCGKKNDDQATYCAGCGQYIKVDPDLSEQNQPDNPDSSSGSDNGGGNRNKIYIIVIVIVAAAAVVAILFLTDVLHWPSRGGDESTKNEETKEEPEKTEEDTETGTDEKNDEMKDDEQKKSDVNTVTPEDTVIEQQTLDGAKSTAEYTTETRHASAKDSNGNIVVSADYELVILKGDDGVNQKINDSLEQDCQDFLDYYVNSEDEETIENFSADNMQQGTTTEADVVYDKKGVLSILYEVRNENPATTHSFAYGLTYSLETGDQMRITDLTDESDAKVLEKMQDALRLDQSKGYLAGTEDQINNLTLNDIDNEDNGLGLHFIVEGGEIVLVVTVGELLPAGSGFLKVPIDVYISTMSYDEYTEDYIFPNSSSEKLDDADLEGLSKEESRLARNEIFARHGRRYEDENLNSYFSKKSWYNGTEDEDHFDMNQITELEWENLQKLNEYDADMGYQNIGEL